MFYALSSRPIEHLSQAINIATCFSTSYLITMSPIFIIWSIMSTVQASWNVLANDGSGSKGRAVPYPSPGPDLSPWELQPESVKEGCWQLLILQHAGGMLKKRDTSTPGQWLELVAPNDHTNRKDRYWGSRGEDGGCRWAQHPGMEL